MFEFNTVTKTSKNLGEYLPTIWKTALRFRDNLPPDLTIGDLVQEGLIAVHNAAQNFDFSVGKKFSASFIARNAMIDALRNHSSSDDILSAGDKKLARKIRRIQQLYYNRIGRTLPVPRLAHYLEVPIEKVEGLLAHRVDPVLQDQDQDQDGEFNIIEDLPSQSQQNQSQSQQFQNQFQNKKDLQDKMKTLRRVMGKRLTVEEKTLITLFYGLDGEPPVSLGRITRLLNTPKSTVYSRIKRALKKLSDSPRLQKL